VFAYDFVEAAVGVRPFFMSDQTSLADFCSPDEIDEVHRKIARLYGADTRGMEGQPLWKVLDSIDRSGGAA
jgi:hypothetical protein